MRLEFLPAGSEAPGGAWGKWLEHLETALLPRAAAPMRRRQSSNAGIDEAKIVHGGIRVYRARVEAEGSQSLGARRFVGCMAWGPNCFRSASAGMRRVNGSLEAHTAIVPEPDLILGNCCLPGIGNLGLAGARLACCSYNLH